AALLIQVQRVRTPPAERSAGGVLFLRWYRACFTTNDEEGVGLLRGAACRGRRRNAFPGHLLAVRDEAVETDNGRPEQQAHRAGRREDNRTASASARRAMADRPFALAQPDRRGGVEPRLQREHQSIES